MVFVLPFPIWFIILLGTSYAWIWQPWKAFCLCHKKRSAFDFGHPGFSSKRAIHLDNMFNLFRVSKGTVIRDAGFWHVSSLLESCSAAHHLGDRGDAASASLSLKFPYLPSGAFYSGNKLVKACWEDSASYVKRGGGGGGLVTKSCPTLVTPWTVAHQAPLARDFPGKDTGVGCHFLFQGILLTQGSNLSLLYCRQILYCWATWEAPGKRTVNTWESSPGFMRSFIATGPHHAWKGTVGPNWQREGAHMCEGPSAQWLSSLYSSAFGWACIYPLFTFSKEWLRALPSDSESSEWETITIKYFGVPPQES